MTATVNHFSPKIYLPQDRRDKTPPMVVNEEARLPCGCGAYVGLRFDNREVAMAAGACSREHNAMMEHFYALVRESLVEPQARPLVDVCAELLDQAERYVKT